MKIKNLILFTASGLASFYAVKNRDKVQQEISESSQLLQKMQASKSKFDQSLATIQEESSKIKDLAQDLSYKIKVLEAESLARLEEIKKTGKEE